MHKILFVAKKALKMLKMLNSLNMYLGHVLYYTILPQH